MLHHKTPAALAGDDWAEDEGTAESIDKPDRRNFIASFQIALAARAPAAIPETAENFAGGGRVDPAETRMVASRQDLSHELQTAKKKEPDSDCLQVMTEFDPRVRERRRVSDRPPCITVASIVKRFGKPNIEREAEYVADIHRRLAHVRGEDTPLFARAAE